MRSTLATRISLLSVGIAVVTALIAGALATGLIRSSSTSTAQATLARLADVSQSVATDAGSGTAPLQRLRKALQGLNVRSGVIRPGGGIATTYPLVRRAVTIADIRTVLAGGTVSAVRSVGGAPVLVEARPAGAGGIVIVQRRADAVAPNERAIRRLVIALLIAGALAAGIGLLVAARLARPLRRTAAAAHSLAAGNRDVTLPAQGPAEVVAVSEAVNSLAGALRHSEARQREFLLSVSHDLRTPLTSLSGFAESLAGGVVPPDDTAHVGEVMLGEARRLERLVGDLLDLARLGAHDFRLDLAMVDVAGVVDAAARVWSTRCAAAGVTFRVERPVSPLWARTDAARLRQVLDGLFENALRVTPAGAPIVLAARPERGTVVTEVRDGGPGLTDADLPVAFEQGALFQRYRGVRQVGTGLGLAIVHGLVTRLGGHVEAGHASEGGARFTVRLPAA
ncbi:MAG TPA: HAMP domain-containing sensor histidine kinase [Jatrophihabitans sp.]|jgi:two-component system sensor histidine kinase BaeS|uniref:sensor histidine kinase n=1 Tax=Jatrophihabitans sp. TaxID=1932789 RepID=UPI002DFED12B|nr:HAMP domain-containing sensor histidine kinase [Jatrophihabitans sp.]